MTQMTLLPAEDSEELCVRRLLAGLISRSEGLEKQHYKDEMMVDSIEPEIGAAGEDL